MDNVTFMIYFFLCFSGFYSLACSEMILKIIKKKKFFDLVITGIAKLNYFLVYFIKTLTFSDFNNNSINNINIKYQYYFFARKKNALFLLPHI